MIQSKKTIAITTLYAVLAFVLVSLDTTYSLTQSIFGNLVGASSTNPYGRGQSLNNRGFLLHIVVFALLIAVPMFMCNSY